MNQHFSTASVSRRHGETSRSASTLQGCAALAIAALVSAGMPGAASAQQTNNAIAGTRPVKPLAGVDAAAGAPYTTRARLAVSVLSQYQGTLRQKNVQQVTSPSTGIYCITPSVALDLAKIYPSVNIEWGYSYGFALLAYWQDTSQYTHCPAGDLEVITYDFNAGGYPVPSANVAFNLIVQ